jgi:hypothetical protein
MPIQHLAKLHAERDKPVFAPLPPHTEDEIFQIHTLPGEGEKLRDPQPGIHRTSCEEMEAFPTGRGGAVLGNAFGLLWGDVARIFSSSLSHPILIGSGKRPSSCAHFKNAFKHRRHVFMEVIPSALCMKLPDPLRDPGPQLRRRGAGLGKDRLESEEGVLVPLQGRRGDVFQNSPLLDEASGEGTKFHTQATFLRVAGLGNCL